MRRPERGKIMDSNDFYDLSPEERAAAYEEAEDRAGVERGRFFELSPEERAVAYEWALNRVAGKGGR